MKEKYGLDFFDEFIDHSYDFEEDPKKRLIMIIKELKRLSSNSNRIFTINSSVVFMVKMAKTLNIKVSKNFMEISLKTVKISPIHQFMIDSIENK
jgi:hypothetical protein